jgi:predicted nucleotidyltransferase component of viral defense system
LIQRSYTAPRDFFDIWYLSEKAGEIDWKQVVSAFHKKMEFKNLEFKGIEQMLNEENVKRVKRAWEQSLKHQIAPREFQSYDVVEKDLSLLLKKIFS